MLKSLALLLTVVLCLGYAFAATKAKDKVCGSDCPAQAAQPDKRGTQASPLVVDAGSIDRDEETGEEAERVTEQKRLNRWTIWLTFVIAACAFLQFCAIVGQIIVYRGQSRIMLAGLRVGHQNAQAALSAASAASASVVVAQENIDLFIMKERPHIWIQPYFEYSNLLGNGARGVLTINISNIGATVARNVTCDASVFTTPSGHHAPAEEWQRARSF